MKLTNINQVNRLLDTVNECSGDVWLTSVYGDKYNLKSKLSQYVAVGALLGEHGSELEMFCDNREDEGKLLNLMAELNG